MPGSRQIRSSGIPFGDGEREPLLEEGGDLGRDVVVARILLHRPRLAQHVHQADVRARVGDDAGELGIGTERGHVVDDLGAERERTARHLRLRRVDRDGNLAAEPLQHRHDAPQLLVD